MLRSFIKVEVCIVCFEQRQVRPCVRVGSQKHTRFASIPIWFLHFILIFL